MFRVDYFIFIFPHILILQLCNRRLVWRLLTDRLTVTWIYTLQCVAMAIDGTTKMRKHSIVDRFRVSTKIGAPGSETMPCEIICLLRHAIVHIACGLTRSYKTYITPVGWVVDFQVSSSFAVSTSTLSHYWQNWYCQHDITGLASKELFSWPPHERKCPHSELAHTDAEAHSCTVVEDEQCWQPGSIRRLGWSNGWLAGIKYKATAIVCKRSLNLIQILTIEVRI